MQSTAKIQCILKQNLIHFIYYLFSLSYLFMWFFLLKQNPLWNFYVLCYTRVDKLIWKWKKLTCLSWLIALSFSKPIRITNIVLHLYTNEPKIALLMRRKIENLFCYENLFLTWENHFKKLLWNIRRSIKLNVYKVSIFTTNSRAFY